MERNNLFDRIDDLLKVQDYDSLLSLEEKLKEYRKTCSETETGLCDIYLKNIEVVRSLKQVEQQQKKLVEFVKSWGKESIIKLEYIEPYGLTLFFDDYVMELVYKPVDIIEKNEIRTKFYLNANGMFKQFVLKKNLPDNHYSLLQKLKSDHYTQHATYDNWADLMIKFIKAISEDCVKFVKMCELSCPFNKDGTHRFKEWRTFAKVEISYIENTGVAQGLKKGEILSGSHVYGGNGSYRYINPRTYILKCTVDSMACEKPMRHTYIIDADSYLRGLLERMGRSKMPYDILNSQLNTKIMVIPRDMNKAPEDRLFYPVDYKYNWIEFLNQTFKNI